MNKMILKTLAGSRAYGLEMPESDHDYHGVFVVPTSELLSIGVMTKDSIWKEGDEDFQSWEIGHFLKLATKCNPTILETFVAPVDGNYLSQYGRDLREMLPFVLSKRYIRDAFLGYAHNQRTKLFNKPGELGVPQIEDRAWKFATQYIRVLIQGEYLLRTGELIVNVGSYPHMVKYPSGAASPRPLLKNIRSGRFSMGVIIDIASALEKKLEKAYDDTQLPEVADLGRVNEFLLRVRKDFWN